MAKLIDEYQAVWNSSANEGYFYFTYFDGDRKRTITVNAENFSIVIDMLRNEKPIYGDHSTARILTQAEEVGEEET